MKKVKSANYLDKTQKKSPIKESQIRKDVQNAQEEGKLIKWSDGKIYVCIKKIGFGRYSEVFQALNTNNSKRCVVKILKPIEQKKIMRQVKILMLLNGRYNVVKLLDIVKINSLYCLVFELAQTHSFSSLCQAISPIDCKYYLYQILKTLHYAHSNGIMHRDVKPSNLAFDPENRIVKMLDWGLAEFLVANRSYSPKVSTRSYKAPELLLDYHFYGFSVDIWSVAVIMAGMIFQKQPFFVATENWMVLDQITRVLGTQSLYDYIHKYEIPLDLMMDKKIGERNAIKLQRLVHSKNKHLATPQALDLLSKIMIYDHKKRLTAFECIQHPYFEQVREDVNIFK